MNASTLVVTGTATLNIIPDRITAEIGLEEYYRPKKQGAGMDNMRRITRRHSVKVAYLITTKNQND